MSDFMNEFDVDSVDIAVDIDLDSLNNDAKSAADMIIQDLTELLHNKEWVEKNRPAKRRLAIEMETLRGLIKMRNANEIIHDGIIQAAAINSNSIGLYKALTDIQKTSLSITTKINDVVKDINEVLKGFQLDAQVEVEEGQEKRIHRGTKQFIESMGEA